MKLSTFVLAAAAFAASTAAAPSAFAIVVTGTGNGQFSNLQNCNGNGCAITNGGNALRLGASSFFGFPVAPYSTLTSLDQAFSFNVPPTQNDFVIGVIEWANVPTSITDPNFNATYNFTLGFTSPNASSDTANIGINIQQPTNPPGDAVTGLTLAALNSGFGPFTLAGITVSDIRFSSNNAGGSTFNSGTGVWFNPESNTARLFITADFAATAVPEPASMALLGAGLLGLGMIRRKRA